MKNKKVIGLLLSLTLVLGLALPGTLAVSADAESSGTEFSVGTDDANEHNNETPLEDANNSEGTLVVDESVQSDGESSSATGEDEIPTDEEGSPIPDANQSEDADSAPVNDGEENTETPEPECTCGTESETHTEGCPLYIAPAEPVPAEESAHIDTCVEGCTGEGCDCSCHELSLFEQLMACETLDELFAIVDATPEEELLALTDEENAEIEAKIAALESEPLPPVLLEDCENESVISEIIYPAVNFDNVAPFGAPVEG